MTVITLPVTPSLSNPAQRQQVIACSLAVLDDHIRLLRHAADSAALEPSSDGELVETLYFLHNKLRHECDRLFSLL